MDEPFSDERSFYLLKLRLHIAMYWISRMAVALTCLDRSRWNIGMVDYELGFCLDRHE